MPKKNRARRAGRKHDPDAKRHQSTREGQGRIVAAPDEVMAKREAVAGDRRVGIDFPLDVLQARGFISQAMRDEGLRFAVFGWGLYGFPLGSCEAIYERMVADGIGADRHRPTAEMDRDAQDAWLRHAKVAYSRMARALGWRPEAAPGEVLTAVREVAQYCRMPRLVADLIEGRPSRTEAYSEMAALVIGLKALVRLQERRTAPAKAAAPREAKITALAREERRAEARAAERGWFSGPLVGPLPGD